MLTETWLTEKDTAAKLEIYSPESHSFIQQDRNGRRGGGTGLLFKKAVDVKKIAAGEKSSFEFSEWRVSFNSPRAKLVVVYRPPYFEAHPITPRVFFEEFGYYLETIILSQESLILTGDYNFHVDVEVDLMQCKSIFGFTSVNRTEAACECTNSCEQPYA